MVWLDMMARGPFGKSQNNVDRVNGHGEHQCKNEELDGREYPLRGTDALTFTPEK
jgi:hypothetical protein